MLLARLALLVSHPPPLFGYLPLYLYIRQAHLFVRTGLGVFHCPEPYLFIRSIGSNSTALPPRTDGTRRSHGRTARAPCSCAAPCPAARAPACTPARALRTARSVFCTYSNRPGPEMRRPKRVWSQPWSYCIENDQIDVAMWAAVFNLN